MALDHTRPAAPLQEEVQVGAADPAVADLEEQLPGAGHGRGPVLDRHVPQPHEHRRGHGRREPGLGAASCQKGRPNLTRASTTARWQRFRHERIPCQQMAGFPAHGPVFLPTVGGFPVRETRGVPTDVGVSFEESHDRRRSDPGRNGRRRDGRVRAGGRRRHHRRGHHRDRRRPLRAPGARRRRADRHARASSTSTRTTTRRSSGTRRCRRAVGTGSPPSSPATAGSRSRPCGPSTASCSCARCSTSRTCRPTRCSRACRGTSSRPSRSTSTRSRRGER